VRKGKYRRRCSRCRAALAEGQRRCLTPGCKGTVAWQATVDVNAPGAPRKQESKSFTGPTAESAAIAWVAERQVTAKQGTYVDPSRRTLGAYLEEWLKAQRVRPNTRADYTNSIRKHIVPRVGGVRLQAFTRLQAKALYQELSESLAEKTIHNVHIVLKTALAEAVKDGLVTRNVVEDDTYDQPRERPEMPVWSREDLATFLAFTASDPEFPFYRLAAATGMRRGELLGLRWGDVDLDNAVVKVERQYTRQGRGKGSVGFSAPKSKKGTRTIDLDEDTIAVLRAHRGVNSLFKGALVFGQADGSPYEPSVLGRRFVQRVRDLKVPMIGLHGLRHTHATLLLEDGVDAKTVSERLGHGSVETTMRLYAHVTPRMRAGAAARFGALLRAARTQETHPDPQTQTEPVRTN
jgi:integrase